MKKMLASALAVTAATGIAVGTARTADATGCSVTWGSTAKSVTNNNHGTLLAVRAGRHECYDRLVLDVNRNGLGWSVRYVTAVRDQGRGAVIPLRGGAFLQVVDQSQVTHLLPMPNVAGYTTFRQVAYGGSFEGWTTIGLGVRARLPFRVTTTSGHLIVDVAHRW